MDTKRHPRPLFVTAALLFPTAALASALCPEAFARLAGDPWAAGAAAAAAVPLPFGLFLLAFRDLFEAGAGRVGKTAGFVGLLLPACLLAALAAVVVLLESGTFAGRAAAFGAWSLLCASAWPLYGWAYEGGTTLATPLRLGLALSCALTASGVSAGAGLGARAYAGTVAERAAVCRQAAREENERLERDRPRAPDLDADLRFCAGLRYRLGLAERGLPF